ncbi:hypothetical protein FWK35_00016928 [Aphis craccivora]|uniref:Uncharacterized protein n=1 Tax=Aphis craccivora TaxID=307492 RepID=A0A6G0YDW9_APHCR|nr:hypothetical protein FWK35_00016928 [Aphis craccivora]
MKTTIRNNALIFNFSFSLKRKIHIVGTLRGQNNGKTGIFTHNQFLKKSIFLFCCNTKTNRCKYLKILPNVYIRLFKDNLYFRFFLCR